MCGGAGGVIGWGPSFAAGGQFKNPDVYKGCELMGGWNHLRMVIR